MGLLACRTVAPSEPDWVGRVSPPDVPGPCGACRRWRASKSLFGKAATLRAAVADEVLTEPVAAALPAALPEPHPIIGSGYHRLDDDLLAVQLDGARITVRDDAFEGFTLIVGTRSETSGGQPFVCMQNRLRGGLHLLIIQEVAQRGDSEGNAAGSGSALVNLVRPV